ncbi:hypothetical protein BTJ39_03355 [Izhakiella australiensis]|uniref:DUF3811 domain-containing protein n=1 Tax=Izhakiella australiensis TaxID=1926881 RepID=A0A1S8YPF0_9GAMM|nr:hypothetical protein [Izhakiella australiensis]OON41019.1 hypothetical protein BTJ39_03355 [Izhakiella australiensis]
MNDKKMISIDQFSTEERREVEELFNSLIQKFRQRTGKEPDSKKEKELTADARQQVMNIKLAKEKEQAAARAKSKTPKKRKPESLKESEVTGFNWSASVVKGRR